MVHPLQQQGAALSRQIQRIGRNVRQKPIALIKLLRYLYNEHQFT